MAALQATEDKEGRQALEGHQQPAGVIGKLGGDALVSEVDKQVITPAAGR
ncbi:hypothetical protein ACSZMV_10815 [Aeromonas veronii]